MYARPLRADDIPILDAMAQASGFPYPALTDPLLESVVVIADADDKPIAACAAKRLVELYLYSGNSPAPVRMQAVVRLHEAMTQALREKGYNSSEIFLPPQIAQKFGRRLERTWGWVRNWPSWTKRF